MTIGIDTLIVGALILLVTAIVLPISLWHDRRRRCREEDATYFSPVGEEQERR